MWACEKALERGVLPHTNLGTLDATDLARLRAVTASQGLMLESTNPDLVAHQGSPTKHPARPAGDDPDRGRAEDPLHERHPRRHRRVRGGPDGVAGGARGHEHIQEIILQNFVPHRKYYGEEPAEIATEAAERFWATGLSDSPHRDPRAGPAR